MKTKRLDWRILSFLKCLKPEVNKLSCVSFAGDSLQILREPVCVLGEFQAVLGGVDFAYFFI